MDKKFLFELMTPFQTLVSNNFDMVVVPGEEGDFGVLPKHSNLISMLRPGILKTYNNNKIEKEYFVYKGLAEVTPEKLIVLSDTVFDKNKFNLKIEKENLLRFEKEKNKTKDEKEFLFFEEKIKTINIMIEMLG
jgi:F-type H+-transporting ATPase subunit epsilon